MEYTVTDLGTLCWSTSYADAINNNGQVSGDSYPSSGYPHAFLYSNGVMTHLGTLVRRGESNGRHQRRRGCRGAI